MVSVSALRKERIDVASRVDRLFNDYLIQFKPAEAITFIEQAGAVSGADREAIASLVSQISRVIPRSARPEREYSKNHHHTYRIGRELGRRVVYLQLMDFHFPKGYRFGALMKVLEKYAKAAGALHRVIADDNGYEVLFWWI